MKMGNYKTEHIILTMFFLGFLTIGFYVGWHIRESKGFISAKKSVNNGWIESVSCGLDTIEFRDIRLFDDSAHVTLIFRYNGWIYHVPNYHISIIDLIKIMRYKYGD